MCSRQDQDSFFSRPLSAQAPIERLPRELLDLIMDRLSLAEKAALTYSSAWLYQEAEDLPVQQLSLPKNWNAKLDFLDKLWTSFPKHKLCVGCARYHPRTLAVPPAEVQVTATRKIGWKYVSELFMTHHSTVDSQVPRIIGSWSCSAKFMSYRHDSVREHDKSKIYVVTYEQPLTLALMHEAVVTGLPSCMHSPNCVQLREALKRFMDGAPRPRQLNLQNSEHTSDLYRCHRCPTEFRFSVRPYRDAKKAEVAEASHILELIHVTDFGTCYTAHNRYWSALTSKGSSSIVSTEPFPLKSSKPLMHHALDWPDGHGRSDEYKVNALTL
jgi:hypothetical protein